MHRVNSRQRLVSWDAFDATAAISDSEHSSATRSSNTSSNSSSSKKSSSSLLDRLKRKRRNRKNKTTSSGLNSSSSNNKSTSHVVPAFSSELGVSKPKTSAALWTTLLPQDATLHVLSFLDESSVRTMMQVHHAMHHLLQGDDSQPVWKDLARQRWPFVSDQASWYDGISVPHAVPAVSQPPALPNMSLLLHLAAETKASCIDESIFAPSQWARATTLRQMQQRRGTLRRSSLTTELRTVVVRAGSSGETAVQFTGQVGHGDRCIRANQPLPRPHALTKAQQRVLRKGKNLWQRYWTARVGTKPSESRKAVWRPFVAPFRLDQTTPARFSVTPRLVSYFEIQILDTAELDASTPAVESSVGRRRAPLPWSRSGSAECVAVGLSVSNFSLHSRMPGWDPYSYGYHGDDGGVFHNHGQMVRSFGPSFGAGDVIGCGLDYTTASIFYTINGKSLGPAFFLDADELQSDWYPTVGVDTNSLIQCNFGTDRPFCFNLQAMIEEQRDLLLHTVGPHEL